MVLVQGCQAWVIPVPVLGTAKYGFPNNSKYMKVILNSPVAATNLCFTENLLQNPENGHEKNKIILLSFFFFSLKLNAFTMISQVLNIERLMFILG